MNPMGPDEIRSALQGAGAERVEQPDPAACGVHVDATLPAEKIRDAARVLRDRAFLMEDVTAVDAEPMMVVYHLQSLDGCRVVLRVLVERTAPGVPSIQDIYPGANWHEREAHDFYGIVFQGHPDLSPLILPEDAGDFHPLLKEEKALKPLGEVVPLFAPPAEEEPAEREGDS